MLKRFIHWVRGLSTVAPVDPYYVELGTLTIRIDQLARIEALRKKTGAENYAALISQAVDCYEMKLVFDQSDDVVISAEFEVAKD